MQANKQHQPISLRSAIGLIILKNLTNALTLKEPKYIIITYYYLIDVIDRNRPPVCKRTGVE